MTDDTAWCFPQQRSCDPSGRPRHQCRYHEGWTDALDTVRPPEDVTPAGGWVWCDTAGKPVPDFCRCPGLHRLLLIGPTNGADDE